MKRAVVCFYLLSSLCCLPFVSGMITQNQTEGTRDGVPGSSVQNKIEDHPDTLHFLNEVSVDQKENRTKVLNSLKELEPILSIGLPTTLTNDEKLSSLYDHIIAWYTMVDALELAGEPYLLARTREICAPLLCLFIKMETHYENIDKRTVPPAELKATADSFAAEASGLWIASQALAKTLIGDIESNKI